VVWDWIAAALSKVGRHLIRPKDQRALNDHSSRQTNILSKVENSYIIYLPERGDHLVGSYTALPDPVLQAIRKQLEPGAHPDVPPITIRILRDDFSDDVNAFQAYLAREDNLLKAVEPYLEPQYASILRLAAFAKSWYDGGKRAKGDEVRNQVGLQYGRAGRKLCNLYLKGYVSDMFQHYLEPTLSSGKDAVAIRKEINDLLRTLIRFSENVHFIHFGLPDASVTHSVQKAIESGAPYIAIHAAGAKNVRKAQRVLRQLDPTDLEQGGYQVEQLPSGTAKVPFLDIVITPLPSGSEGI
jgi:hypothetical protein